MNKTLLKWLFWLCAAAPAVVFGEPSGYLDSLFVYNDTLHFSFHETGCLDESVMEDIQRGTTVVIEYQVQLWDKSSVWRERLLAEKRLRMKIHYDRWEQSYMLTRHKQEPELMDVETIHKTCSVIDDFGLWSADILEPEASYVFMLRLVMQPMSMENIAEIQQWISGEMDGLHPKALKKTSSLSQRAGNWLLRVLVNLSGFGDRVIQVRSEKFRLINGQLQFERDVKEP